MKKSALDTSLASFVGALSTGLRRMSASWKRFRRAVSKRAPAWREAVRRAVPRPHLSFGASRWRIALFGIISLPFVLALGLFTGLGMVYWFGELDTSRLAYASFPQTTILYDRSGEHILYEVHGEVDRKIVAHEAIPDVMRWATLAAEDDTFYSHHGVDIVSLIRAVQVNLREGSARQGASTITQQLARNVYLTRAKTWSRKIEELFLTLKIERHLAKDDILDLYLNTVPYGSNAYGVETASETFFGKSARDLALDEAALLASLPKAPTTYSPYGNRHQELIARKETIIRKMEEKGWVSEEEARAAIAEKTLSKVKPFAHPIAAPHFVFYVLDQLEQRYGREAVETGGMRVYTTLDWDKQQTAEQAVREGAVKNISRGATNAALVSLDARTGEILAMVGSRDYFDKAIDGEVNVTVEARQPGSSFKPIAYGKAFEKGFQPETLLYDLPTNFGPDGSGEEYQPNNYDGRFHGKKSMREALAQSLNIPAVETLYLAGVPETIEFATRLGITTLTEPERYGLALVLGGAEVRPLDMAAAFGTYATQGVRSDPTPFTRIVGADGRDLELPARRTGERVIDAEVARKVTSIMSDNSARAPVFGSRSPLILPDRPVAAKTGTTQNFRDAWTVGFTPSLVTVVWAGNNDNHAMKEGSDGVYVAAPIWNQYMRAALSGTPVENFEDYERVESDKMLLTGRLDDEKGDPKYCDAESGERLSKKKRKKLPDDRVVVCGGGGRHSILHYVNRDDPLGEAEPDYKDPMYKRWEEALGKDVEEED